METLVFYLFALLTLCSGWMVIYSKNLLYSAFSLLSTFFGVAGLYALLMADFIAATQVLIYVGGVLMLLLFGIMLTTRTHSASIRHESLPRGPGAAIAGAVLLLLLAVIFRTSWNAAPTRGPEETVSSIGMLLMGKYLIPFEVASILLLVALIGAVFIARREKE